MGRLRGGEMRAGDHAGVWLAVSNDLEAQSLKCKSRDLEVGLHVLAAFSLSVAKHYDLKAKEQEEQDG